MREGGRNEVDGADCASFELCLPRRSHRGRRPDAGARSWKYERPARVQLHLRAHVIPSSRSRAQDFWCWEYTEQGELARACARCNPGVLRGWTVILRWDIGSHFLNSFGFLRGWVDVELELEGPGRENGDEDFGGRREVGGGCERDVDVFCVDCDVEFKPSSPFSTSLPWSSMPSMSSCATRY